MKSIVALIAISVGCCGAMAAAAEPLRVGVGVVDITPPANMPFQVPQRPPFPVMVATGTHDPLYTKAIVFESDGIKAAIVACDRRSSS